MVRPVDGAQELAEFMGTHRRNAVLLGPGGGVGPAMQALVLAALGGEAAVVLDADALTSFADAPQALIDAIKARKAAVLLTPHEGEFSPSVQYDGGAFCNAPSKLEKARRAAAATGAICLLKGADTVVAAPDGRAAIIDSAPAPGSRPPARATCWRALPPGCSRRACRASRRPARRCGCMRRRARRRDRG